MQAGQEPVSQPRALSRSEREKSAHGPPGNVTSEKQDYQRVEGSTPGEPPVYSISKIHQGWMQILTRVHQYNRSIPPLLEHAHLRAIEGNRLILGVLQEIFQQKIAAPDRAQVIEQAIFDLHDVKLRIEIRVVDQVVEPSEPQADAIADDEDPLIAAGKLLGGVVDESG